MSQNRRLATYIPPADPTSVGEVVKVVSFNPVTDAFATEFGEAIGGGGGDSLPAPTEVGEVLQVVAAPGGGNSLIWVPDKQIDMGAT